MLCFTSVATFNRTHNFLIRLNSSRYSYTVRRFPNSELLEDMHTWSTSLFKLGHIFCGITVGGSVHENGTNVKSSNVLMLPLFPMGTYQVTYSSVTNVVYLLDVV